MKRAEKTYNKIKPYWHRMTPQKRGEVLESLSDEFTEKEKKEFTDKYPEIGCIIKKIPKRKMHMVTPKRRKLSR